MTLDDLCWHILDHWRLRARAAPELADYHRRLLALMCREFGIEWHDDAQAMEAAWGNSFGRMPYILPSLPKRFSRLRGPFDGFLEYEMTAGEKQKRMLAHIEEINTATLSLKRAWAAYLRDLLLQRWPDAATRTTSWERLRDLGLGDPVDETDFF